MKELLKRLQLIAYLNIDLEISQLTFYNRFSSIVDAPPKGLFRTLDKGNKEYIGKVYIDNFKIKRRKRFFEPNFYSSLMKGIVKGNDKTVTVQIEVNGINTHILLLFAIILIVYTVFMTALFFRTHTTWYEVLFISIHGILMLFFLYKTTVRNIKRVIYNMERELYFLTKNN